MLLFLYVNIKLKMTGYEGNYYVITKISSQLKINGRFL